MNSINLSILFLLIFPVCYSLLIFYFSFRGRKRIPIQFPASGKKVRILIAARNEEQNLRPLLLALKNQTYPKDLIEIIIADDHSEDNSLGILHSCNDIKTIEMTWQRGKKQAIAETIKIAQGEIFLFTDADCIPSNEWVSDMTSFFTNDKIKMVLGPVILTGKSIFAKLQALEFAGLIGITRISARTNNPLMANGANMAIRKETLLSLPSSYLKMEYASGDDMFTMLSVRKLYGKNAVVFSETPGSSVFTLAISSLSDFITQRIRWVSKTSGFTESYLLIFGAITLFCNLSLLILMILSLTACWALVVFFIAFGLKFLTEFPMMRNECYSTKRPGLLWMLPFLQIIYPFYVVFFTLGGLLIDVKWKGRKI